MEFKMMGVKKQIVWTERQFAVGVNDLTCSAVLGYFIYSVSA